MIPTFKRQMKNASVASFILIYFKYVGNLLCLPIYRMERGEN